MIFSYFIGEKKAKKNIIYKKYVKFQKPTIVSPIS